MTSAAAVIGTRLWDSARLVWDAGPLMRFRGAAAVVLGGALALSLAGWNPADPSLNVSSALAPTNPVGGFGAVLADLSMQSLGLAAWFGVLLLVRLGLLRALDVEPRARRRELRLRALAGMGGVLALSAALAAPAPPALWRLGLGLGGLWGHWLIGAPEALFQFLRLPGPRAIAAVLWLAAALPGLAYGLKIGRDELKRLAAWLTRMVHRPAPPRAPQSRRAATPVRKAAAPRRARTAAEPALEPEAAPAPIQVADPKPVRASTREVREVQKTLPFSDQAAFPLPELGMLKRPPARSAAVDEAALRQNAALLEGVLAEFGVRGTIDHIRPGPVVTLYELSPAPGVKHARVVALSDDIARSMSARACRVSVVQGRNAIGIELPNRTRETVYLRDLLASADYDKPGLVLPLALGQTIGGEPYVADLARMPHLLIAGTTGSGKSVGVNAMILSILYRLSPEQCRFIMIDPKMLELSVYDGIPHLLAPVVTDPKKAVVALKWTVREMEDRYRRMSKIGVRNVASYNQRAREALERGEHFERTVQTGFDEQGRPAYETEKIRPEPMPYLVVVMDEMADLMLVAGKDVEGAVQRLAQMARAAGIHLIMATQRPSVDVITGTIKANFPTRISFQVTSKIDSRTILGEQGAEQLLGQGDMLYMAGGGRITRLHGPFVEDGEVEAVAEYLRRQGEPRYLEEVTADDEEVYGGGEDGESMGSDDLYDRAVAVVTRDRKASTSYIQRRLQIGYNRAATLMERMEQEGVVGPANHAGKRDILAGPPPVV
ncbi:DNA translocase FtsK 4TM domain-containing protein [Brevundimonas sp. 2R-24]|uniref:DNA translocase FtsK n=1 Tax=Peiella sedimenti TaxID=3061083 RepID=A0ABT8SKJ7_9CAUL|nr:DNA translocase FtsK 4TM domain-containing protein [Caulobacteraceae bacterium XZ-24]